MIVSVYQAEDELVRKSTLIEAFAKIAQEISERKDETDFKFHFRIVERKIVERG